MNFTRGLIGEGSSFFERLFFLKKYDLLFYLTDGSIFFPTAKKNILHIQSPLAGQPAKSLWGKFKLKGWNQIIYNSKFTQTHSEKNWPKKSAIIYPPVDTDKIRPLKKKKYILSVGRFFGYLKDKKHELMIKTFKRMSKQLSGWSLHLAGSAQEGDKEYLQELKKLAEGFPVNFYPNLGYDELIRLYGKSSIYWHGAGYGENDPVRMEHFGISTVEAMAAGCVPVVIAKGGQLEIVEDGKSGYIWSNLAELNEHTLKLINNKDLMEQLSKRAVVKADTFNKNIFKQKILNLI